MPVIYVFTFVRKEPVVPEEDQELIKFYHEQLLEHDIIYRKFTEAKRLTKREVQFLLRFVDAAENLSNPNPQTYRELAFAIRNKRKKDKYQHLFKLEEEPTTKKKKYCRLYLERWNSIVEFLIGIEYPTYTGFDVPKVGDLLRKYSNLWDEWQSPAYKDEKITKWKYPDRFHIPNLNFMFNQIHEMLGLQKHNKYFPLPTTKTSVKKLRKYWQEMTSHLMKTNQIPPLQHFKTPKSYKQPPLESFICVNKKS